MQRQITLPASGEFLLRITANNLVSTGSYNLGFQCLSPPEPQPTAIRRGSPVSGSIGMPGEADFYTFAGQAGELVALRLIETSDWGGPFGDDGECESDDQCKLGHDPCGGHWGVNVEFIDEVTKWSIEEAWSCLVTPELDYLNNNYLSCVLGFCRIGEGFSIELR